MSTLFKCMCSQTKVSDVHMLDYRHNGLLEVPGSVFLHERSLDTLHLDSNRISDLPRELFSCVGLRKLTLSDNDIQLIPPAIGSLINLEHLDCSKNAIIELPDNIKGLKHLHTIELSVNPLGRLPDGFTQLFNLTQLFLNDCFIEYLPGSFGRLVKLKVLELRENRLKTLPSSVSRLTELERLDLGNNEFQELPAAIGSLTNLAEMWCDHNKLRMLPPELGHCRQLMYLDACENQLQWLPTEIDGCVALSDLHLTQNRLQELPETLGKLSSLTTVKVDQNRLKLLPFSIGGLSQLVELNVSKNELEELPPTVGLLRNLRTLYADDNFLIELPPELGSCSSITVLSLRGNQLSTLPDELGRIHQLRVLNVSQNQLRYLPLSFTKLKSLQALWLADNQSQPLLKLQTDFEPETHQKVLTCYLLPQQPSDDSGTIQQQSQQQPQPPPQPHSTANSMRRMHTMLTPIDENAPASADAAATARRPASGSASASANTPTRTHIQFQSGSADNARRGGADVDSRVSLPKDVSDRHVRNAQLVNNRSNSLPGSPHNGSPVHANAPGMPQAGYVQPGLVPGQSGTYLSSFPYAPPPPPPPPSAQQQAASAFFGNPHAQLARTRSASREREENAATALFNERVRNGLAIMDKGEQLDDTDSRRVAGRRELGAGVHNGGNSVWVRQDQHATSNGQRPQRSNGNPVGMRGYESDTAALGPQAQFAHQAAPPPQWTANVPTALLSNMHGGAQARLPANYSLNGNGNLNMNPNMNMSMNTNTNMPGPHRRPAAVGSGYVSDTATITPYNAASRYSTPTSYTRQSAAQPTLLADTLTDPGVALPAAARAHRCKHGHRHHHRSRASGAMSEVVQQESDRSQYANYNAMRPMDDARSNAECDPKRPVGSVGVGVGMAQQPRRAGPPPGGNWPLGMPMPLTMAGSSQSGYASDSTVRYPASSRPQRPSNMNGAFPARQLPAFDAFGVSPTQAMPSDTGPNANAREPMRFFSPPLPRAANVSANHSVVLPDQLYSSQADAERARGQFASPKSDAAPARLGQPHASSQPPHHLSTGSLNVCAQPAVPPTSLPLNGPRRASQLGDSQAIQSAVSFSPSRNPLVPNELANRSPVRANGNSQRLPFTSPLAVVPPTPTQSHGRMQPSQSQSQAQSTAQSSSSSSNATQSAFETDASNTSAHAPATNGTQRGTTAERNSSSQLSSSSDSGYSHTTQNGQSMAYSNVGRLPNGTHVHNQPPLHATGATDDADRRSMRNMAVFGLADDAVSTNGAIPPPPSRSPPPPPMNGEQRESVQSDCERASGAFASDASLNMTTELNTLLNTVNVSVQSAESHSDSARNSISAAPVSNGTRKSLTLTSDSLPLLQTPGRRSSSDVCSSNKFLSQPSTGDIASTNTPFNTSASNSFATASSPDKQHPNMVSGTSPDAVHANVLTQNGSFEPAGMAADHGSRRLMADANQYTEVVHVAVNKNPGLGFSIAGGVGSPGNPFRPEDQGIFVTKVNPDGPASGRLRVGDKILSVNGIEMQSIAHRDAVAVLKGTVTNAVNLIVERLV